MKRRPHDIVEISWVDSSSPADTWTDTEDYLHQKTADLECRSVGYLLFETADRIGISASLSLGGKIEHQHISQVGGIMTIPKVAILARRILSKGIQE